MKIAILYSGAKDSNYALYMAKKQGHEVVCLVSLLSKNLESYMFHTPNIRWAKLQSESLGIPIETFETEGIKEKELEDLKNALNVVKIKYHIKGVVSGAIASQYQKERVDNVCKELQLKSLAPLWHINPEEYLLDLIKNGFKVKIVGVFAEGLDKTWLGMDINKETILKLKELHEKYGIHLAGEGGEYESFVYDCPMFRKKIEIIKSEIDWQDNSGILIIKKAKLSQ